jgi:hypothetical protein
MLCIVNGQPSHASFRRGVAVVESPATPISVRSAPRTSARVLTTFVDGDPISIDWARKSGTWYVVKVGGIQGWSNTRYFSTRAEDKPVPNLPPEDLRELPSPESTWYQSAVGDTFVYYFPSDGTSEPTSRPSTYITWRLERPRAGMLKSWWAKAPQLRNGAAEEIAEVAIDCATQSSSFAGSTVYRDFNGQPTGPGDQRLPEYAWSFSRVIPNSVGEAMVDSFCSRL